MENYHNMIKKFFHKGSVMPKISVIIPVYNVEQYLPQCLDSLKNQILSDLEFICINDGSVDGSLDILQAYAAEDHRFVIINQKNRGQGYARNKGLEAASGEYIGFVDPDDWVEPDMYEQMYNLAEKYNADTVECNYEHYIESPKTVTTMPGNIKRPLPETSDGILSYNWTQLPGQHLIWSGPHAVWNKIFSKKMINDEHIRFTEGTLAEDALFTIHSRICSLRTIQCPKIFYHYRTRQDSACNKISDNRFDFFTAVRDIKRILTQYNIYEQQQNYFYKFLLYSFPQYYNSTPPARQNEFKQIYYELLPDACRQILDDILLSQTPCTWKQKIFSVQKTYKLTDKSTEEIFTLYRIFTILGIKIKVRSKQKTC